MFYKQLFALLVLTLLLVAVPSLALAFDVTVTGTQLRAEYKEPSVNKDGSPLVDLKETRVYFQIVGKSPAVGLTVPASSKTGGQRVSGDVLVPVLVDQEADVNLWATALDLSGNESDPSNMLQKRIDRLAPGAPE